MNKIKDHILLGIAIAGFSMAMAALLFFCPLSPVGIFCEGLQKTARSSCVGSVLLRLGFR